MIPPRYCLPSVFLRPYICCSRKRQTHHQKIAKRTIKNTPNATLKLKKTLNGTVYHYRDKSGLECDAVVHLRNGSYGLIEIKLGGNQLINDLKMASL